MSQIALPLVAARMPVRIVIGNANQTVLDTLAAPQLWPYRTAVLTGAPGSGKTMLANWFVERGLGDAIDNARDLPEPDLFHRWNRAQEFGTPLLIVGGEAPWQIALPDLRSRLGAAVQLEIGLPDDAMAEELLIVLAEQRGLILPAEASQYLVPRAGRSFAALQRLVAEIDRLSLERMVPATQSVWRAALEAVLGPEEPRLL